MLYCNVTHLPRLDLPHHGTAGWIGVGGSRRSASRRARIHAGQRMPFELGERCAARLSVSVTQSRAFQLIGLGPSVASHCGW
jgi:hypothetical protein